MARLPRRAPDPDVHDRPVLPQVPVLPNPRPRPDIPEPEAPSDPDRPVAIWQGFDHRWRDKPHRLVRHASLLQGFDSPEPSEDPPRSRFEHKTHFKIGAFDDTADVATHVTRINSKELRFVHGQIATTLSAPMREPAAVKLEPQQVPLPEGTDIATLILRGFQVRCESHPRGLPTRGFGFGLSDIATVGGQVSYRPRFFVHPDQSPDRRPGGSYSYAMTLYYTLVAAPAGRARFTEQERPQPVASHFGPDLGPKAVGLEVQGLGGNAFSRAVLGIRDFQWRLRDFNEAKVPLPDGRFIRALTNFVTGVSYSPATGRARFQGRVFFSNQGPITFGFHVEHRLETTLIQYDNDDVPAVTVLEDVVPGGVGQVQGTAIL